MSNIIKLGNYYKSCEGLQVTDKEKKVICTLHNPVMLIIPTPCNERTVKGYRWVRLVQLNWNCPIAVKLLKNKSTQLI